MTAVDLGEQEPFWRRHLGVLIVGGFAVLLVVIVLLQLLEEGDVAGWLAEAPKEWAYVLCFGLVWLDAVIPIFPGETTLSAASTLAAQGELELELVMLAGALGAIVGDSSLFWIARKSAAKVQGQLDKALENPKVRAGWDALDRSPGLLIVAGRYVPGMRFAVNASMGLSHIPYRRFLPWSVVGGVLWSVYTCALAYKVATTLSGFPLASLVISSLITSAALAAIYFVDRRRRRAEGAEPADSESRSLRRGARPDRTSKWIGTRHRTPAPTIALAPGSLPRLQAPEAPVHGTCHSRSRSGQRSETGASRQAFSPGGSRTGCSCGSCRSG